VNVLQSVIDLIIRDVSELPDRTSPDDQPDVMLVTGRELEDILLERLPMLEPEDAIAVQLRRLNDNLEAGVLNIRTHHPSCITPKDGDYTVQQLDAMSKFINQAIKDGRVALPPREGGQS
jgi:hypothetical protein